MLPVSERDYAYELIRNLITTDFTKSKYTIDENGDMIFDMSHINNDAIKKYANCFDPKPLMMVLDPELLSYRIMILTHLHEKNFHVSFTFNVYYPDISIRRDYLESAISKMNNYIKNKEEIIKILNGIQFDDRGIITTRSLEWLHENNYEVSDDTNSTTERRLHIRNNSKYNLYTTEKFDVEEILSAPPGYSADSATISLDGRYIRIIYTRNISCNIL